MDLIIDIIKIIKRRFKKIIAIFIVSFVCAFFTQSCVKAQTINNNLRTINDSILTYFDNVANLENFKNYIITSDYIYNGTYNNYSVYYLCLTNSDINNSDTLNLSTTCDKLYSYYYYGSNYSYNTSLNENLTLYNTIYYSNSNKEKDTNIYLICLIFITSLIFFLIIFNRIFRNRYGGLNYGKI